MHPSIRQQKFAVTKLSILRALIQQIETCPLENISIKDICREANIATATFFLYFSHKTSILEYFVQLWSLEIAWWVENRSGRLPAIEIINGLFDYVGQRAEQYPHLMAESISWMARRRVEIPPPPLSPAELALAFPDFTGMESVTPKSLMSIFASLLDSAQLTGAISRSKDVETAVFSLLSIFFSTPLLAKGSRLGRTRAWYQRQLEIYWAGLNAKS